MGLDELHRNGIRDSIIKSGGDRLRNTLIKQAYKKMFTQIGSDKHTADSQDFIHAYNMKKQNILVYEYIQNTSASIAIKDQQISNYFYQNIKNYTASSTYTFYLHRINCSLATDCIDKLDQQLKNHSFEELSINNTSNPSGYFPLIKGYKLDIKLHNLLKNLKVGELSKPVKLANNGHMFIKLQSVVYPEKPQLSRFYKSVKATLFTQKQTDLLTLELQKIKDSNPDYINADQSELFAFQAQNIGLDKHAQVQKKLESAYQGLYADYGYFSSPYFQNMDWINLRAIVNANKPHYQKLYRYDFRAIVFNSNIDSIDFINKAINQLKNNSSTDSYPDVIDYEQITKSDFASLYKNLLVNVSELKLNKWVLKTNTQANDGLMYLFYKSYEGAAKDSIEFIKDYKRFSRSRLGSYSGFMKHIGTEINLTINPIIYTDEWSKILSQ